MWLTVSPLLYCYCLQFRNLFVASATTTHEVMARPAPQQCYYSLPTWSTVQVGFGARMLDEIKPDATQAVPGRVIP